MTVVCIQSNTINLFVFKFILKQCQILPRLLHCPKNNLNLCLKTEPVAAGADATVHVCFWARPIDAFSNRGKLYIADKQSSAGLSIWKEDDQVHLTEAASVHTGQAALLTKSDHSTPARKRIDSVVPVKGGPERAAVCEPGWMSGTANNTGGRGGGWSASQGPPRHGRGRGRGRSWSGNRSYPILSQVKAHWSDKKLDWLKYL